MAEIAHHVIVGLYPNLKGEIINIKGIISIIDEQAVMFVKNYILNWDEYINRLKKKSSKQHLCVGIVIGVLIENRV